MSIEGKLFTLEVMDENLFSPAFEIYKVPRMAIHAIIEGSPVGTLKLQCSNDIVSESSLISNWIDYNGTDSLIAISGATQVMYNVKDISFKWIRLVYVFTSGTGLISSSAHSTRDK